ncbi:MAG: hypothetical protein ABN482_06180 [Corticimicrobacter sp.]|uniref:hypothetical protein n=1 Tax=Corticimicrobacter sp. TaxID=2678536 RepID=UPI0032DBA84A
MKSKIFWDLPGFNICLKSRYADLYALEADIGNNVGSSNFSALDTLDWLLTDKATGEISFLMLTVPSTIKVSPNGSEIDTDTLENLALSSCLERFIHDVAMQDEAIYTVGDDTLTVTSDASSISHTTQVSDDLYLLLDQASQYRGFLLKGATTHIPGHFIPSNSEAFGARLLDMLRLCTHEAYDSMSDLSQEQLRNIENLESACRAAKSADSRLEQIIAFTQQLKVTFYDLET